MRKIAIIGDVHDRSDRLEATLELLGDESYDLCLLTGDVGRDPPWRPPARFERRQAHDESVQRVLGTVRRAIGCPVLFVPGNHDLPDPPPNEDGINVDGRLVEIGGLRVAGFGGAGPSRFGFPYEWSEETAQRGLDALFGERPEPPDLWLCHSPPADCRLDKIHDGRHVGSGAVGAWLRRLRPRLFVCGHIHEASGIETIDGVPCLNAGALGEPYGRTVGWIVEWDGGPTAIHSRRRDADGTAKRETLTVEGPHRP